MKNSFIGAPVERIEDLRFLRGRGQYVDDVSRPGQLHAAILRSSVAHGRIKSIDVKAAQAMPGVHAVLTAKDIGTTMPTITIRLQPLPQLVPFEQPMLAFDKVRYVGEPVAMVVAESPAIAEDALDLIEVDIEPLPAVGDRGSSTLLFEKHGSNQAIKYDVTLGDADAAFKNAPYTRRETFRVHRHAAVPMEPRGLLAEWDAAKQRLTVHGAAKVAFFNRRILADKIGLPVESIDMVETDVGGGFGARGEFYPEDFLVPFAARKLKRPVKWTEDRRENLLALQHARDMDCDIEIACTRDGKILGLRGATYADVGAYIRTNGLVGPRNVAQFLSGPYRIPAIEIEGYVYLSNKTPSGTYRGPGRYEADFFRERLLDLVAQDLGLDRVEFRRRNLIAKSEMPYPIPKIAPYPQDTEFDSGNYASALDKCLKEFNWAEKAKLNGRLVDGRYHGIAVGCFIEGGAAGPKETAKLVIEPDGMITVLSGASAVGQGLETVFAQIAADAIEIPLSRIKAVLHGSTTLLKEGFGSYHSRAVVMGGTAILNAANKLHDELRNAAAQRFGCAPDQVTLSDERIAGPGGKSARWSDFAGLATDGEFSNHHHTYAYGTHAAHVAVDPKIGQVQVLDYVAVEDVGRIMNPITLKGQLVGAIVQGLGGTFLEHFVYDAAGQILTGSFADYLMPLASDFPVIRGFVTEEEPSPINPLGAKGAGEGGIIPVGGVMANAVAAALSSFGVQPKDLPLSPSRLWHMVQAARQNSPQAAE